MPEGRRMTERDCVFCGIVEGTAPSFRVDENERSIAFLDINPLAEGHCLVIPKRHVPWWHDLTEEENASLFGLAKSVAGAIERTYAPDFVAMYVRGRRIPHAHIFLVPTFAGDPLDRFFNALEGFQEAPARLAALRDPLVMEVTARRLAEA
jgi:histidine triad (HIT) family protein